MLLVGSGLTAIDVALTLTARGQRQPIVALSRHSLLPRVHGVAVTAAASAAAAAVTRAILDGRGLARALRVASAAIRDGVDPCALVDALRADTPTVWRALSAVDRARFLAHLRASWDVHRHRLAPEVAAAVAALVDDGRLSVRAGRLIAVRPLDGRLLAYLRPRGARRSTALRVDRIVNCTGPSVDVRRDAPPLVRALVAAGLARPCPLGLGLWTDADGRLVDAAGRARDSLRVLGPLRRGEAWESTAIPELRLQAAALADALGPARAASHEPAAPR